MLIEAAHVVLTLQWQYSLTSMTQHSLPFFSVLPSLVALRHLTLLLRGLLGKEDRVDGGENTTTADGNVAEKLVELLIVTDGELDVAGDDTLTLVVTSSVAGKLDDLGSQVLEHSGEVDGSTSTDTVGVVALTESVVDTANRELEASLGRAALGVGLLASTTASLGDGGGLLGCSGGRGFLGLRGHLDLRYRNIQRVARGVFKKLQCTTTIKFFSTEKNQVKKK